MSNKYDFRSGRSIKNVNPQAVGEELEKLRSEHGQLTPAVVVDAAKDPESPLHAAFEWDTEAAAQQYLLQQARRLIVSIRILNAPTAKPTIAYVSVKVPEVGRSYVPTVEAMTDENLRVRVLTEIRTFLESIERRYAHFAEVATLLAPLRSSVG